MAVDAASSASSTSTPTRNDRIDPKDPTKTKKGTKIVSNSSGMDKNAFLKILVAELSNQDPTQSKDSTQYIAQMAQFASLEQLSNLNSSITFSTAGSMVGETVKLTDKDSKGQNYVGTVKGVTKNGDDFKINVEVTDNGTKVVKTFDFKNVIEINQVAKSSGSGMNFSTAATMIGKTVTLSDKNAKGEYYAGVVKGVSKSGDSIKVNVEVTEDDKKVVKAFDVNNITDINETVSK